jgi:hypothetical protein
MDFCFYPKHEYACAHLSHCPHLGGAALGDLVYLANESGEGHDRLHRQLDAERKSISDLVAENQALKREIERLTVVEGRGHSLASLFRRLRGAAVWRCSWTRDTCQPNWRKSSCALAARA